MTISKISGLGWAVLGIVLASTVGCATEETSDTQANDESSDAVQEPVLGIVVNPLPLTAEQRLDLSKTVPVESAKSLKGVFGGATVKNVRKANPSDRSSREKGSVMTVTEEGAYEMTLDTSTGNPEGIADVPPTELEPTISTEAGSSKGVLGWSNGVDNRSRIAPPVGVGMFRSAVGNCSATLLGIRLVRTAAHCVVKHSTTGGAISAVTSMRFDYMRNGTSIPVSVTPTAVSWGGNYLSAGCGTSKDLNNDGDTLDSGEGAWGYFQATASCSNEDYALVTLPSNWWATTGASAYGFRMMSNSAVNADGTGGDVNRKVQNAGYPGCGAGDSPANCISNSYYTDRSCTIKAFESSGSDVRRFSTSCDITGGMSGGPIFERNANNALGYYLGNAQWDSCAGAGATCTSSAPSHYMGHNQWLFDLEVSMRNSLGN